MSPGYELASRLVDSMSPVLWHVSPATPFSQCSTIDIDEK